MTDAAAEPLSLPPRPELVAELRVTGGGSSQRIVLTGVRVWHRHDLSPDVADHVAPVSTALSPRVIPGEGTVMWLVGYRLSALESPGDTVVTSSLLLHLGPRMRSGTARALWYEDHMEVPHRFFTGAGSVEAGDARGVVHLDLDLADAEHGDHLHLVGVLRSAAQAG